MPMPNEKTGEKVYRIPADKIPQSLKECFHSALHLWTAGNHVADVGALHIAVGLWILALEELGKYALLQQSASEGNTTGILEIPIIDFKSHRIKSEKGQTFLLERWGIDLSQVGIPLTSKTREGLWYVAWDDIRQEFRRAFDLLDPYAISRTQALGELMRRGIRKMHELQNGSLAE